MTRQMFAGDVRQGDVLHLATGCVKVLEAYLSHGGCEWLVQPHPTRKGTGASRLLWAYPSQTMSVEPIAQNLPRGTLQARPAKPLAGAAARKAAT